MRFSHKFNIKQIQRQNFTFILCGKPVIFLVHSPHSLSLGAVQRTAVSGRNIIYAILLLCIWNKTESFNIILTLNVLLGSSASCRFSLSLSVCLQQSTMRTKSHRTQTTATPSRRAATTTTTTKQSVYETSFHIFRLMLLIFSTRINPTFSERQRLFAVYISRISF